MCSLTEVPFKHELWTKFKEKIIIICYCRSPKKFYMVCLRIQTMMDVS